MPSSLQQHPLGTLFPQSIHSVCCSLPKMEDVIGYEEKYPQTIGQIRAGYPRFVQHFYLKQIVDLVRIFLGKEDSSIYLVCSENSAKAMKHFVKAKSVTIHRIGDFVALSFAKDVEADQRARAFLQHTGSQISSRQAEEWLFRNRYIKTKQEEELFGDNEGREDANISFIQETFAGIYDIEKTQDILIFNSGMNTFYTAFNAVKKLQKSKGKSIWVQIGWLYLDTSEILKKLNEGAAEPVMHYNVFDYDTLEALFMSRGKAIAGIIIETPTNPLLQTADIKRIYAFAQEYDAVMIIDPTMATPYNVDVLPYADLVVNSLTKYAANQGDVMGGAIVLNASSAYYAYFKEKGSLVGEKPYHDDLRRLAFEIKDYISVVEKINRNTVQLAAFLQKHPNVEKVYWAYEEQSCSFYEAIARREDAPGGVISISLKKPLRDFYDKCAILKSPSFGTVFTFICPFMYLAHYDLVSKEEGRKYLKQLGIDPDLVRISVGTEPIEAIIEAFDKAL